MGIRLTSSGLQSVSSTYKPSASDITKKVVEETTKKSGGSSSSKKTSVTLTPSGLVSTQPVDITIPFKKVTQLKELKKLSSSGGSSSSAIQQFANASGETITTTSGKVYSPQSSAQLNLIQKEAQRIREIQRRQELERQRIQNLKDKIISSGGTTREQVFNEKGSGDKIKIEITYVDRIDNGIPTKARIITRTNLNTGEKEVKTYEIPRGEKTTSVKLTGKLSYSGKVDLPIEEREKATSVSSAFNIMANDVRGLAEEYDTQIKQIQNQYYKNLIQNDQNYKEGKISESQFNKNKIEIQKQFSIKRNPIISKTITSGFASAVLGVLASGTGAGESAIKYSYNKDYRAELNNQIKLLATDKATQQKAINSIKDGWNGYVYMWRTSPTLAIAVTAGELMVGAVAGRVFKPFKIIKLAGKALGRTRVLRAGARALGKAVKIVKVKGEAFLRLGKGIVSVPSGKFKSLTKSAISIKGIKSNTFKLGKLTLSPVQAKKISILISNFNPSQKNDFLQTLSLLSRKQLDEALDYVSGWNVRIAKLSSSGDIVKYVGKVFNKKLVGGGISISIKKGKQGVITYTIGAIGKKGNLVKRFFLTKTFTPKAIKGIKIVQTQTPFGKINTFQRVKTAISGGKVISDRGRYLDRLFRLNQQLDIDEVIGKGTIGGRKISGLVVGSRGTISVYNGAVQSLKNFVGTKRIIGIKNAVRNKVKKSVIRNAKELAKKEFNSAKIAKEIAEQLPRDANRLSEESLKKITRRLYEKQLQKNSLKILQKSTKVTAEETISTMNGLVTGAEQATRQLIKRMATLNIVKTATKIAIKSAIRTAVATGVINTARILERSEVAQSQIPALVNSQILKVAQSQIPALRITQSLIPQLRTSTKSVSKAIIISPKIVKPIVEPPIPIIFKLPSGIKAKTIREQKYQGYEVAGRTPRRIMAITKYPASLNSSLSIATYFALHSPRGYAILTPSQKKVSKQVIDRPIRFGKDYYEKNKNKIVIIKKGRNVVIRRK
jgi:hypothetical protein